MIVCFQDIHEHYGVLFRSPQPSRAILLRKYKVILYKINIALNFLCYLSEIPNFGLGRRYELRS